MKRPIRYECLNCEMSYWTSGQLIECPYCAGFVRVATTDVPSTAYERRAASMESVIRREMKDVFDGFDSLLRKEV